MEELETYGADSLNLAEGRRPVGDGLPCLERGGYTYLQLGDHLPNAQGIDAIRIGQPCGELRLLLGYGLLPGLPVQEHPVLLGVDGRRDLLTPEELAHIRGLSVDLPHPLKCSGYALQLWLWSARRSTEQGALLGPLERLDHSGQAAAGGHLNKGVEVLHPLGIVL